MTTPQHNLIIAAGGGENIQGSSWSAVTSNEYNTYTKVTTNSFKSILIYYNNYYSPVGIHLSFIKVRKFTSGSWQTITIPIGEPVIGIVWDNSKFVLYTQTGRRTSTDGTTWTYTAGGVASSSERVYDYWYFNNTYFAGTYDAVLKKSSDGITWTSVSPTASNVATRSLAYGNGTLVRVYRNSYVEYSTDNGDTWTLVSIGAIMNNHVAWNAAANRFVISGWFYSGLCYVSSDGITWESVTGTSRTSYHSFSDDNAYSYLLGTNADIYRVDPVNKTYVKITAPNLGSAALYAGTTTADELGSFAYEARGTANAFAYSSTGASWSGSAGFSPIALFADSSAPKKYIGGSSTGYPYWYSANGSLWSASAVSGSVGGDLLPTKIIWDSHYNKYFGVASRETPNYYGEIASSSDGVSWAAVYAKANYFIKGIASNNTGTVVATTTDRAANIVYSTNGGLSWNSTLIGPSNVHEFLDVIWDGLKFVAVGEHKSIASSVDGINWTLIQSVHEFNDIVRLGNNYIAARDNIYSSEPAALSIAPTLLGPWKFLEAVGMNQDLAVNLLQIKTNTAGTLAVTANFTNVALGKIYHSNDTVNGTAWSAFDTGRGYFEHIDYINNRFVLTSNISDGKFLMATDAQVLSNTWNLYTVTPYTSLTINRVMYHDGYYYATTNTGKIARSNDLSNWTEVFVHPTSTATDRFLVSAFGKLFVYAYNLDSYVYDGSSWELNPVNTTPINARYMFKPIQANSAIYGYYSIGYPIYSTDGTNFQPINRPDTGDTLVSMVNKIDDKVIMVELNANSNYGYYWQTSTDPAAEFSFYPRAQDFTNISYIQEDNTYHLSAGTKLLITGDISISSTYNENNVKSLDLVISNYTYSFNATRTAYNENPTEPAYVYGGRSVGAFIVYSNSPYTGQIALSIDTLSGVVSDVVWDGENFLACDGINLFISN